MRFMHFADAHLDYWQYHLEERAKDIARAFYTACSEAAEARCDLVLIAGDLFHKRAPDARTLLQSIRALLVLRKFGITVLIVPGNHDGPSRSGEVTWLSVLNNLGYLTMLDVSIADGQLWLGSSAIYETDKIRVVGVPYLGAALPRLIPQIAEQLSPLERKYTVLLTHAGLEGEMPGFREPLTMDDLEPLRTLVDYVALGHLHKPFQRDGWVFNPGSLEALSVDETAYAGGWYLVDVDTNQRHRVLHVPYKGRRPLRRLQVDVGEYQNPEQLRQAIAVLSIEQCDVREYGAMLELTLLGQLQFARAVLDLRLLAQVLAGDLEPLKTWVRDRTSLQQIEISTDEGLTRAAIEEQVLHQLLGRDARYAGHVAPLARLASEIKAMALAGAQKESIWDHLLAHSIVKEG